MNDDADDASRNLVSTDEVGIGTNATSSWDPYEVWLTRVRRPRELAASRTITEAVRPPRKVPQ